MTRSRARSAEPDHSGRTIAVILYLRLSDGRTENGSMPEREAKLRERATQLGWVVVRVVIENDLSTGKARNASAFKRRRVTLPDGTKAMRVIRPGFRSILEDLSTGRATALLAEDLDRTMRDPRDAEDLIDVIREHGLNADSLSGSLKFTDGGTDSEIMMARIAVTVANKASADTSRRVSAGRERKAAAGKFGGGSRPYGFGAPKVDEKTGEPVTDEDGKPVIDYDLVVTGEAEQVEAWADAVLSNVAMRDLARYLRDSGVPTVTGTEYDRWQSTTVRDILLRPRNAGFAVHKGEIVEGARLPWNKTWLGKDADPPYPILPEDIWRAVVAKLTDPSRLTAARRTTPEGRTVFVGSPGPARRWQGTGIYLCHCGAPVGIQCGTKKTPAYRCDVKGAGEGHIRRNAARVDEWVDEYVITRLSGPRARKLLDAPADDGVDLGALRAEVAKLRGRKNGLATAFATGDIDRAQLATGTKTIETMLSKVEAQLAAHTDRSPLAGLPVGSDIETMKGAWRAYPLGSRREVIKELVTVTILPSGQRGRVFDPSTVVVKPRRRQTAK